MFTKMCTGELFKSLPPNSCCKKIFISAGHFSTEVHGDSSSEQFVIIWVTGNEEPFLALLHEPYYSLGCCHSGFNPFCTYNNYSLIKNRKCTVEKRKCSALLSFNIGFCTSLLKMSLSQNLDWQDTSFLIFCTTTSALKPLATIHFLTYGSFQEVMF